MNAAEWFLDLNGKKAGPYTVEQVQALVQEGEVHGQIRATSERLNQEWITVAELIVAFEAAVKGSDATGPSTHSQPPPRPTENLETVTVIATSSGGSFNDATQGLFDALQSAKERKAAAKLAPAPQEEWGSLQRPQRKIPGQLWMIVALVLVLGTAIYGTMKLLAQKSSGTPGTPSGQANSNVSNEAGRGGGSQSFVPPAPPPMPRSARSLPNSPPQRDAPHHEEETPSQPPDPRDNPQAEPPPPEQPPNETPRTPPPPVNETPEGVAPDAPAQ